ncbi:tyrosine-protein phosphatase non-receptor type substrate 1-like isoform X3 [Plectropomus leopardus]|uniref:tyrosine-protein phosphatase non-receptor type substrate 1-like isoform X3 n=1 Tax=Plectropomus leopardus TaxID=160734 RepID=UPI001C4DB7C9|nr:tyrosine-protein phosphatase non-receptor type substrate 1-like isoform X3 [Plectropomus leopardus]
MKLLLSSLLLASLRARSSWCVSSTGTLVTQSPDVSVMEGDTVNITCCWTGVTRLRVTWLKNETDNKTGNFSLKNCSQGPLIIQTSNCSYLTFMNVTTEDSGRYICKVTVEIPFFAEVEGNGTVITVTDRSNTKDDTAGDSRGSVEEVFITVPRYLCILALVITVFCINKLTSKSQQHTPAAPGNELTSVKRTNEEEEARDEREMETE